MDSIPLVVITGQVATPLIGKDGFQEADVVGITVPVTKHNYQVRDVNHVSRIVQEAFYIAKSGRPGPVLIDIPKMFKMQKSPVSLMKKLIFRGINQNLYQTA